jgi:hypothetical protein
VTDPGSPTPPPSHPTAWGSNVAPPPSTPVTHATASTIAGSTPPRKRWIVVLVGVCVLVLGFAVAGTALFFTNTWPPMDAAIDFTNEIERGNLDGALEQGCEQLRTQTGREFIEFIFSPYDLEQLDVNPFGIDRDGDRASVDITVRRLTNADRTWSLNFVKEAGEWRPCVPE